MQKLSSSLDLEHFVTRIFERMTRGNQRDEARLKNAKDAAGKGVKKEGSYLLRKEADSTALADKVFPISRRTCNSHHFFASHSM